MEVSNRWSPKMQFFCNYSFMCIFVVSFALANFSIITSNSSEMVILESFSFGGAKSSKRSFFQWSATSSMRIGEFNFFFFEIIQAHGSPYVVLMVHPHKELSGPVVSDRFAS